MSDQVTLQRLRLFLLGVVAFIFLITPFELVLLEHTEELFQWVPFVVSGLGLLAIAGAWFSPGKKSLRILRWVMLLVALTSIAGVYFHFSSNLSFTREINPSFSFWESIWPAMKGSSPLLASGILFLASILGLAATYKHPEIKE
ncbi:hypothetical protein LX73_1395 [Fodinibius salinus]|uniref:Uncharacterized protein n=1 Tax=Fodinibius salinus TaxID=860790 RepID=A0A5D3YL55_9BACT|nr:hypothetical protein [Fodinibius salinus]TYP93686.1 hypothetical protein LX73_1395 [Fodinibius salinus]